MKAYRLILSLMASVAVGTAFSQTTGVVCEEFDQIQLTHVLTPTGRYRPPWTRMAYTPI